MAPVAHALAARGVQPSLVLTGQHPQLQAEQFGLASYAVTSLDCAGEPDPEAHARKVAARLLSCLRTAPDLLIVQGDTSSALGGAIAAFAACVPVAHVEAGLRTHDRRSPWPEEDNRIAIDARADLLFAPSPTAAMHLRREGVPGEIHVTGNTGIDALMAVERTLPSPALRDSGTARILVTCHRRESWQGGLQSIGSALLTLVADGEATIDLVLHPNPHVAAVMRNMHGSRAGIRMLAPLGHAELVRRIRDADLVLSDSGGIQEEAPALGTPLLVLRDKTERPEAIASGNALLVGTSSRQIIAETRRLLRDPVARARMSKPAFPFGDGRSGSRIAAIIEQWLERQRHDETKRTLGTGRTPNCC